MSVPTGLSNSFPGFLGSAFNFPGPGKVGTTEEWQGSWATGIKKEGAREKPLETEECRTDDTSSARSPWGGVGQVPQRHLSPQQLSLHGSDCATAVSLACGDGAL